MPAPLAALLALTIALARFSLAPACTSTAPPFPPERLPLVSVTLLIVSVPLWTDSTRSRSPASMTVVAALAPAIVRSPKMLKSPVTFKDSLAPPTVIR